MTTRAAHAAVRENRRGRVPLARRALLICPEIVDRIRAELDLAEEAFEWPADTLVVSGYHPRFDPLPLGAAAPNYTPIVYSAELGPDAIGFRRERRQ